MFVRTRRTRAKHAAAAFLADWRHPLFAEPGLFYATADEAGGGGNDEGEPAPAPAAESAPAETPAADTSPEPVEWDDSALDAAFNEAEGIEPQEPADEPAEPADAGQPADIDEADANLARRFHLDPEDLPANPERRTKFLDNLRQRAAHDDRVGPILAEWQRRQQGQEPPATAAEAAAAQPPADDPWKPLHDVTGGEEATSAFRAAVQAEMAQRLTPLQQMAESLRGQIEVLNTLNEEYHRQQGFAAAEAPEGIDLSDAAIRQKVEEEAWRILRVERDAKRDVPAAQFLREFNLSHAIPRAVHSLFTKQLKTAQANKAKAQRTAAIRGTPASTRPNAARHTDEDSRLDAAFDALQQGGRAAAARVFAGG